MCGREALPQTSRGPRQRERHCKHKEAPGRVILGVSFRVSILGVKGESERLSVKC